jgi:2,3,4,5-tetrahydropyridine-2-carboxylate N-succinyltransferase
VPPRRGASRLSYIGRNVVLMPSFVNIGAYVDEGTMVDTWATVGSCAQIGKNVHLSGGVGIGGVLEPLQANPTIIGDNCFVGARSEVVEGVIVEDDCVISMGVFIGQSTKHLRPRDGRNQLRPRAGRLGGGVSGSLPSADGKYSLYCAVIVKQVDAQTRAKTGINELLRDLITIPGTGRQDMIFDKLFQLMAEKKGLGHLRLRRRADHIKIQGNHADQPAGDGSGRSSAWPTKC